MRVKTPDGWKEKKQLEVILAESKVEDKESAAGTKEVGKGT